MPAIACELIHFFSFVRNAVEQESKATKANAVNFLEYFFIFVCV